MKSKSLKYHYQGSIYSVESNLAFLAEFYVYFSLSGMDNDIDEKHFNEAMDEAASGGVSDKSLSDERSELQGGLTDSVSTSDEEKKSTKTAEAKERNIESKEVHVQPQQTSEQKICVLKRCVLLKLSRLHALS